VHQSLYDIIIVGAGPIGLACALEAEQKGLHCLLLEKGALVNSLYHYPVNMTFFSTSERLEIGGIPFVSNQPKPSRNEALEYYRRVAGLLKSPLHLYEAVSSIQSSNKGFAVATPQQTYQCRKVIIATGFYGIPFLLDIPGESLPKVTHYYQDPHAYAFRDVVVVGANNSAVDAALETWRKGARVTMVIRGETIGERVKYWVRPDIINRIEEGSIQAYFQSNLLAIRSGEVDIQTPKGKVTLPNDHVLLMTGYQPDLTFLENCGIQLSPDAIRQPVYNPITYQTNVAGLYLAGVICGGMNTHRLFIENSREHAKAIIQDILQQT
jgi:thioredoxin reductase (NADPH)